MRPVMDFINFMHFVTASISSSDLLLSVKAESLGHVKILLLKFSLLHFWKTKKNNLLYSKNPNDQAFRSAIVRKSVREFSHDLDEEQQ